MFYYVVVVEKCPRAYIITIYHEKILYYVLYMLQSVTIYWLFKGIRTKIKAPAFLVYLAVFCN